MDQEQRARDLLAQAKQRAAAGDPKAQAAVQKLQAIIQKLEQKRLTAFNADGSSNLSYDDMLGADRPKAAPPGPSVDEMRRNAQLQAIPLPLRGAFNRQVQRFGTEFLNTAPNTAQAVMDASNEAFGPGLPYDYMGNQLDFSPRQPGNPTPRFPTMQQSAPRDVADAVADIGGSIAGQIVGPGKIIPGQKMKGPVNLLNLARQVPGQVARNVADAALYFGINRPKAEPGQARQSVGEGAIEGATNPFNLVSAAAIRAAGRASKAVLEAPQSVNAAGRTLTTGQPANALFNMPDVLNYTRPPEALKPKTPLVFRKADQLTGAMVGGSIGGSGPADAQTSNNNQGGPNVTDAGIGAAVGYFLPRSMRNAVERVWSAGKGSDRVALSKILSELKAAGIKDEQEFMSLYRAMYGDKPATPADIVSSLRGMVTGAARLPGKTGDIATARKLELSDGALNRRMDDVTGGLGIDANNVQGGLEAMKIAARQAANPVYEQLYKDFTNLSSPELMALMNNNRVKKFAREVNDYRDAMMLRGRPIGDMEYMDKLKQEFDTQIRLLRDRGMREGDIELQTLETLRGRLVNELDRLTTTGAGDAAQSAYRQAREVGGQAPQMDAAFAEGRKVFNQNMSTEQLRAMMQEITGLNLNAAQLGLVSKFVEKAENTQGALQSMLTPAAERKLTEVFGAEKAQKFKARIEAEIALNNSASRMAPGQGSQTSEAQGGVAGLVDLFSKATDAVKNPVEAGLAYLSSSGAMNRAQRDAFGQRALEPITEQSAREIYSGAGRGNRTTAIPPRTAAAAAAAAAATAAGTGSAGAQESAQPNEYDIEAKRLADAITANSTELEQIRNNILLLDDPKVPVPKKQELLKTMGLYNKKIDNTFGEGSIAAVQSAKAKMEARRAELEKQNADYKLQRDDAEAKSADKKFAEAPKNYLENFLLPFQILALGTGFEGANIMRGRAVKKAMNKVAEKEAELNNLIGSGPVVRPTLKTKEDLNKRFAGVNEVYRQGGAKELPFDDKTGMPQLNKDVTSTVDLYPPNKNFGAEGRLVRPNDIKLSAMAGAEGLGLQLYAFKVQGEIDQLKEDMKDPKNRTIENLKRLQDMQNLHAGLETVARLGQGYLLGRTATMFKPYPSVRPDMKKLETERLQLSDYILQRNAENKRTSAAQAAARRVAKAAANQATPSGSMPAAPATAPAKRAPRKKAASPPVNPPATPKKTP